jgi:hypothetical protein
VASPTSTYSKLKPSNTSDSESQERLHEGGRPLVVPGLLRDAAGGADGLTPGGLALSVLGVGVGERLVEIGMQHLSLLWTTGLGLGCLSVENRARGVTRRRICSADGVPTVVRPDARLEP